MRNYKGYDCKVRKIKGDERAYSIRAGNYRVVYEIYDKDNLVLFLQVARRSETP